MNFQDGRLTSAFASKRASSDKGQQAVADNFEFEEKVTDQRRRVYESFLDPNELERSHLEYLHGQVRVRNSVTFIQADDTTRVVQSDKTATLIHVEDITKPATNVYGPAVENACNRLNQDIANLSSESSQEYKEARDRLEALLSHWFDARGRDERPVFAAPLVDVESDADAAEWALPLRNRLGMQSTIASPRNPVILLQVRYRVRDVEQMAAGLDTVFVAPTVLDSGFNQWFCPSPRATTANGPNCGWAVDLERTSGPCAEVLHPPFRLQSAHLHGAEVLWDTGPGADDQTLFTTRDHHVTCVRSLTGRPDFGALRDAAC